VRRGALALHLAALAALSACGKTSAPSAAAFSTGESAQESQTPMNPIEVEAWARATDGGEEERMRLHGLIGCTGLRERADRPAHRLTALRAMKYCDDFSELPWLASIAASAKDGEALEALDAILDQAARPRRSTDPEDAQELSAGCQALLALSRSTGQPRPRRVMAVRALRMLSERGCVKRAEIPSDLDAKD
jgi:hypothetical protein